MITAEQIRRFVPHAWDGYVQALVQQQGELDAAGINTSLRWTHFLAQIAHESADLTATREDTRWTPEAMKALWPTRFPLGRVDPRIIQCRGDPQKLANLAYSARSELGNLGGNDGWDYRGGGLLQITGRANYHAVGMEIGADLEGQPELIENPTIALRAAIWFWSKHQLNQFADHNYGRAVSNGINRGNPYSKHDPIGYRHRGQRFQRAWAVFGDGNLPTDETLYLGAHGGKVTRIQGQLKDLGYQIGAADGVYGPTMARAVAGFKLDQKRNLGVALEPDEVVGPLTIAALDSADRVRLSPERTGATESQLADAGSTEMAAGGRMQAVGGALTGMGTIGIVTETGLLQTAISPLQQITALKLTLVPALAAIEWGLRHLLWVALIVGGVWCWRSGWAVKLARLAAHQLGMNLFR